MLKTVIGALPGMASQAAGLPYNEFLAFYVPYARRYGSRLGVAILVSIPLAVTAGAFPWFCQRITQLLTAGEQLTVVAPWIALILVVVAIRSGLDACSRYLLTMLHARFANDLRNGIYRQLHAFSLDFHLRNKSGELASLVNNDAQAAAAGLVELFAVWCQLPFVIIALLAAMLYFNPVLALVAIGAMPVLGAVVGMAGRRARAAERAFFQAMGSLLGLMVESLTNVKQVKSFGLEENRFQTFEAEGEKLIELRRQAVLAKAFSGPVAELTSGGVLALMILLAYWQITSGTTTMDAIVGCLAAAYALKDPAKRIAHSTLELQRAAAAVGRIDWILRRSAPTEGDIKLTDRVCTVALERVSFSYDGRRLVLAGLTFEARRGERIAIVGRSGAGKTTLVDLLVGFFPCTAGRILIDGHDLSSLHPVHWRRQIGIVSQEPFLFDDTIEENIRLGWPDASAEQIAEAAARAGCGDLLARLPDGMATRVGERGSRLSGGERKRVALARALVRPISVLILDEATSELGSDVEERILDSVDGLAADLITFHVSHRRSVVSHCDRVIVLGEVPTSSTAPGVQALTREGDPQSGRSGDPERAMIGLGQRRRRA